VSRRRQVEDDRDEIDDQDEVDGAELPPSCEFTMSGWCGQLRKHAGCYFNHPDGIAAVRAGTYGMWEGHQWVCTCPCHEIHNYPPCPHPDHHGQHERVSPEVDHDIQLGLF
jgi:hypothetical protein